jgi:predicted ATPase
MISLVEVRNFRSLRALTLPLGNFHVLVGPNASGKTTFLDVFRFLGDIIEIGIDKAIAARTPNFLDLTFGNAGGAIEFAVEAFIPDTIRQQLGEPNMDRIRYEIQLGLSEEKEEHSIFEERVVLYDSQKAAQEEIQQRLHFPDYQSEKSVINRKFKLTTYRQIVHKIPNGNGSYSDETLPRKQGKGGGKGWIPSIRLGFKRSALERLPANEEQIPATFWLRDMLATGAQLFILDSLNIRQPSPPGLSKHFLTDGSNLPWVIEELRKTANRFKKWLAHVQTALPDILDIDTIERLEDRHRYLRVHYKSGLVVPSWLVSDGTLRLLALTLPAYLPDFSGLYLIEEPENGIHPAAMETVYQSLSAIYGAQMLLATHSPIILGMVEPQQVLCFAKTADGVTDIVQGDEHPLLRDWQGDINLSQIYASGILG